MTKKALAVGATALLAALTVSSGPTITPVIGPIVVAHHGMVGDASGQPYYAPNPWGGVVLRAPPGVIIDGAQMSLAAPRPTTTGGGQTGACYWVGLGAVANFLQAGVSTETWGATVRDNVWIQAWSSRGTLAQNQQSGPIAPGTRLQVVLSPTAAGTQEQVQVRNRVTQQVLLSATVALPAAAGWHEVEWIAEPLFLLNRWHHATQSLALAVPAEQVPFTGTYAVANHWHPAPTVNTVPHRWTASHSLAALTSPLLRGTITGPQGQGVFWTPAQPARSAGMDSHEVYLMNSRWATTDLVGRWTSIQPLADLPRWPQRVLSHPGLGTARSQVWPHRQWRPPPWWWVVLAAVGLTGAAGWTQSVWTRPRRAATPPQN